MSGSRRWSGHAPSRWQLQLLQPCSVLAQRLWSSAAVGAVVPEAPINHYAKADGGHNPKPWCYPSSAGWTWVNCKPWMSFRDLLWRLPCCTGAGVNESRSFTSKCHWGVSRACLQKPGIHKFCWFAAWLNIMSLTWVRTLAIACWLHLKVSLPKRPFEAPRFDFGDLGDDVLGHATAHVFWVVLNIDRNTIPSTQWDVFDFICWLCALFQTGDLYDSPLATDDEEVARQKYEAAGLRRGKKSKKEKGWKKGHGVAVLNSEHRYRPREAGT